MIAFLKKLNWIHTPFLILFHSLAIFALFHHPRPIDIALLVVMYAITGFGITIGFHRLICHRAFSTPRWLKLVFAFCGTAGLQGGPIAWTTVHRKHHQMSDKPGDPHTPLYGVFYAHIGWIFARLNIKREDHLVKDLLKEPFFRFLDLPLMSVVPALCLGAICYWLGGWQGVLYGVFLRNVLMWNATWAVNSLCHTFGSRLYETPDKSTNFWPVGIVALGEGWHNNHHARPRCAYHGHLWWQFDMSSIIIRQLERLGLATNVIGIPKREEELRPAEVA